MATTQKILEQIDILGKRPKMIIPENDIDYKMLTTYILGYFDGIGHMRNTNLQMNITRWYGKKTGINMLNRVWTHHILRMYPFKTDEELKEILFQSIKDYFAENPDWDAK